MANAEYQYTLQSDDLPQLMEWAPKLLQKMRTIPQLTDVSSDQQNSGLAANLVDRSGLPRRGWGLPRSYSTTPCTMPSGSARYPPCIRS